MPSASCLDAFRDKRSLTVMQGNDSSSSCTTTATGQDAPSKAKDDRFYKTWDRFSKRPPAPRFHVSPSLEVTVEEGPGHAVHSNTSGLTVKENATTSFKEAVDNCRAKVKAIVQECRRINMKYTDRTFLLSDPDSRVKLTDTDEPSPSAYRRIEDIYDDPKFLVDNATPNDVRQGQNGDCWFLAAVTAVSGTEEQGQAKKLLSRLFVERDEQVGVYGFVFHRDGEWVSVVVDDFLFIAFEQEEMNHYHVAVEWEKDPYFGPVGDLAKRPIPDEIVKQLSKGSKMLTYAGCKDSNETWLPLLEKAYAKLHGDYHVIEGGWPGEAIVDLTGGVTQSLSTEDILDKDKLWEELTRVNQDFLFACGTRSSRDWQAYWDQFGKIRGHAYTILQAAEFKGHRLLKIRNPWGKTEWNGAWSDGSKEWDSEAMLALNHTFGDDGVFWMTFKDCLRHYPDWDRTRLFDDEWIITQQWTSVNVHLTPSYQDTRFRINVHAKTPLVVVLSQPDSRYFDGLTGRYNYELHFRLYQRGNPVYLVRSNLETVNSRACSVELPEVEPGVYYIIMKVTATRWDTGRTYEEAMRAAVSQGRRNKLLNVGLSFDRVHSKGKLREKEQENAAAKRSDEETTWVAKMAAGGKQRRLYKRAKAAKTKLKEERRKAAKEKQMATAQESEASAEDAQLLAVAPAAEGATPASAPPVPDTPSADKNETAKLEVEEPQDEESQAEKPETEKPQAEKPETATPTDAKPTDAKATDETPSSEPPKAPTEPAAPPAKAPDATAAEAADSEEPVDPDNEDDELNDPRDLDFDWDPAIDDPVFKPSPESDDDDEDDDPYLKDPWDAVCVVGLQVYTQHQGVVIKVCEGHDAEGMGMGEQVEQGL